MADYQVTEAWVDRYLRDELSDDEREAFELALMDSPELADSLAAAMGVQQALELGERHRPDEQRVDESPMQPPSGWRTLAMAATLVLAVFSTTMYWRASNEVSTLQNSLNALREPVGQVLSVPVEIMRSSGVQAPRAVAIPDDVGLVLLDIEVPASHASQPLLQMRLTTVDGEEITAWQSSPLPAGNHNAVIRADQLPRGEAVLEVHTPDGQLIYQTALEFR